MADEIIKRDENRVIALAGVTDDIAKEIRNLLVDPVTGALKVTGTVSVSIDIQDEGVSLTTSPSSINFTGDGVTASAVGDDVTVTINTFADPMTTRGDMVYRNAANATARLAVGVANAILGTDGTDIAWVASTGTGSPVRATSPSLTTPTLGVASATSINKITLTAPATGATITIADGKTLTVNKSLTLDGADGKTVSFNKTVSFTSAGDSGVLTLPNSTTTLVGIDTTDTLTNKRITPRITTITSHATPTINTDNCDAVTITAQAEAITSMTTNLSGTPTNFQRLLIRIKDGGTARAITWGASFQSGSATLPTTTVAGKTLMVGLIYDSVDSKWTCEATGSRA